ncbi:MAG TPA: carbohydrate porin [Syntrophobacteraceae bacterium]|nr:carbohydrate porin [Syntrophobacteraceae bacterium]
MVTAAKTLSLFILLAAMTFVPIVPLHAQPPDAPENPSAEATQNESCRSWPLSPWFPWLLGLQFNGVYQDTPHFHSPYEGPRSLSFGHDGNDFTQTYGIYLGWQLTRHLQAYVDTEMFQGHGISDGTGLGGYLNGDVIRAGSSNLPKVPYVARAYLRYYYPLSYEAGHLEPGAGQPETEKLERGMDQIPGEQPVSRWEVKIGKLALTDDFDQNRYADNNRTQFMNYDFLFNTAWDYASDTRGYSFEALVALYQPGWRLAFAIAMEPNTQNGANYDWFDKGSAMAQELGYNLEFDLKPNNWGTVLRFLTYLNEARMGGYDAALALAAQTGATPDILLVEKLGGTKYGLGFNFEQPLADEGETGIFGRLGWNDGRHETWCYTESDRHASLGLQVSGVRWKRPDDRLGVAWGVNGLSTPHKDYLAAGGIGMLLGDGALSYGCEQVMEVYYRFQITRWLAISPDFQLIQNPGYNSDRGPVEVYGVRVRVSY